MSEHQSVPDQIAHINALLRQKLGVRGATLAKALRKAKHRLPRRVHSQAMRLAQAETVAFHPKLRLTLDVAGLAAATKEVAAHLDAIDLADRRKGWWLGMFGGMAFNILLFAVLCFLFLLWRGVI